MSFEEYTRYREQMSAALNGAFGERIAGPDEQTVTRISVVGSDLGFEE